MRVLFFGTADVSVPYLRALLEREDVAGVVTRPDRQADRGHHLQSPPVKLLAQEKNVPVFQPESFTPDMIDAIKKLQPDIGVVVSYGKLIPDTVFTLPAFGCFNVHFSLLPKYRGAAPVQWALINGETQTGVTTFWLEKGLDTGPVLVQRPVSILPEDDAALLFAKLIPAGVEAMHETIARVKAGQCTGRPQEGEPTYAPTLKKQDGRIDWAKPANAVANQVRGTRQWPSAFTTIEGGKLNGQRLKILRVKVEAAPPPAGFGSPEPGYGDVAAIEKNRGFVVRCGEDFLAVEEVQPENKKPMSAWAFLQSGHVKVGTHFA